MVTQWRLVPTPITMVGVIRDTSKSLAIAPGRGVASVQFWWATMRMTFLEVQCRLVMMALG